MAVVESWFKCDLHESVKVQPLCGSLFSHNGNANKIGVSVTNGGEPVALSGTVSGYVVVSDGTTVPCTGDLSGNTASIILPAAAYVPGNVCITIMLTSGSTITTLCAVVATVVQSRTDTQVDPGSVVTDWTNTINAAMQNVVDAARYNIALPYASLTYPIPLGKHCIYNNLLYKCIYPITTSEAFTSSHWVRVRVADDVFDNNCAITQAYDDQFSGCYKFRASDFVQGGVSNAGADTERTTLIKTGVKTKVKPGSQLVFVRGTKCQYLSLRVWNKGGSVIYSDWLTDGSNISYTFGADAEYFRLVIKANSAATTNISPSEYDAGIYLITATNDLPPYGVELFAWLGDRMIDGAAIVPGNFGVDVIKEITRSATPLIPVSAGDELRFYDSMQASNQFSINLYGANLQLVSSVYQNYFNSSVSIPSGVKYIRFNQRAGLGEKVYLLSENQPAFKKIRTAGLIDVNKVGNFVGYCIAKDAQDNVGFIQDPAVTDPTKPMHTVTNYFPVEGGGKIAYVYALHSSSYGIAYFDENRGLLGFNNSNANTTQVFTIPNGAKYAIATIFSDNDINRSLYYVAPNYKPECVNVTDFGAIGNRVFDNADILQRVIGIGGTLRIPIYIPTGNFLISQTLRVQIQDTLIYGDKWERYSGSRLMMKTFEQEGTTFPKDPNNTKIQKLVDNENEFIAVVISQAGCSLRNIQFMPNFETWDVAHYDYQPLVATAIKFDVTSFNVDAEIYCCAFWACNYGVTAYGKNIVIDNNYFVHCNSCVKMTWSQRYSGEQRDIMIQNNRFHSCGRNTYGKPVSETTGVPLAYDTDRVNILFPEYIKPELAREIIIMNNFADYGGVFISGNILGADIHNNTAYLCRNSFINASAKVPTPTGTGTTYAGTAMFEDHTVPEESWAINVNTLQEVEYSSNALVLTQIIAVQPNSLVNIQAGWSTSVWGHGLYNADGQLVDAILANTKGYYIIPDDVTGIRVAMKRSDVATSSISIYTPGNWDYTNAATAQASAIAIKVYNNRVIGAEATDYTPGRNILGKTVVLQHMSNFEFVGNDFMGGTDDVVTLYGCNKFIFNSNNFINSPSYCLVYGLDNALKETVQGTDKHYIVMTNCSRFVMKDNVAFHGLQYNSETGTADIDRAYVRVPVLSDDPSYTVDPSNTFEYNTTPEPEPEEE